MDDPRGRRTNERRDEHRPGDGDERRRLLGELERAVTRIADLGLRDDLTGLFNRAAFYERLDTVLAAPGMVAVVLADLDGLRSINDLHGHLAGDKLLVGLGQRLRSCVRPEDLIARMGGGEFAAVIGPLDGEHLPIQVAERMLAACGDPIDIGETTVKAGVTIGVAIAHAGVALESVDSLLGRADAALHAAKSMGRGCYELSVPDRSLAGESGAGPVGPPPRRAQQQRAEIESLLSDDGSIVPVFQPIIDVDNGAVIGHEALARFSHPTSQPPNAWFAQAHRFGLGNALEAKAMLAALAVPDRPAGTFIAVNASPTALASLEFQRALPHSLEGVVLEITENELVHDNPQGRAAIFAARSRGALLAVDDAGAGYAGMKQLIRLTPDVLKLDRELIHGIHRDLARAALVESFVTYAHRLQARICAEGVDDLEDLALLAELGVTYAQGFAIGRPAASWTPQIPIVEQICRQNRADIAPVPAPNDRLQRGLQAARGKRPAGHQLEGELGALAIKIGADEVYVSRYDSDGRYVELIEGRGGPTLGNRYRLDDFPTTASVVDRKESCQVLVSDPRADGPETDLLRAQGIRSLLMVPIIDNGTVVGLLELYRRAELPWSSEEVAEATRACQRLGPLFARLAAGFAPTPRSRSEKSTRPVELVRSRMGRS